MSEKERRKEAEEVMEYGIKSFLEGLRGVKIVNLTPHMVRYLCGDKVIEFPSQGVARVKETLETIAEKDGIRFVKRKFSEVEGIPPFQPDTLYIVSNIVFEATNRSDLIVPADFVRDEKGQIVGCRAFVVKK